MTGAGTNSYIIGSDKLAVVDPGPAITSHIENLAAVCQGKLHWIFVTHTHPDHSPAAMPLAKLTGAEVLGMPLLPDDGHQDRTFRPDITVCHLQSFPLAEFTLTAFNTPGHVANHVCYRLEEENITFVGDHMMNGSTVVIIPPSGDMLAYIESLRLLQTSGINSIAPGHGELIENGAEEIERLIAHRMQREDKVIKVLGTTGEITLEELVPLVYDDVDTALHRVAIHSLLAHLLKLEKEQRATRHIKNHWAFGRELWLLENGLLEK